MQVVPEFMLWTARQHEMLLLKRIIVPFVTVPKDLPMTKCLVDAFTYYGIRIPPPRPSPSRASKSAALCAVCRQQPESSERKCTRCGLVTYCSKKCAIEHWQGTHKLECQANMMQVQNSCDHCTKSLQKTLKCGKCNIATYCGRECQVAHWKSGHKHICKTITKIGNTTTLR